jgi:hypothetical protein
MALKGKVTIINSLLACQFIYIGTDFHTPQWALNKYKEIIMDFLWDKKPPKYTNIISNISDGGLKLQDIESKLKSIKTKWLHAICATNTQCAWKKYLSTYFNKDLNRILLQNKMINDYSPLKVNFYQELF